jgi:hypothetical protein
VTDSGPIQSDLLDRVPWRQAGRRLRGFVFGDRVGLAVFLGTICFAGLYWRADVFITDSVTLVRTLEALSEGRLWIEPATGDYLQTPGTVVRDGRVYGRNYGQVVLALPFLWAVQILAAVTDLPVALVALWHLAALAFVLIVGRLYDRERVAGLGGSALVAASFLVNLALARPLSDASLPLLALQITTLLAAGFGAVLLYRLLACQHDRRLGVLAGGAVVLVSPVGFWATIPKRHVLVATLCLAILYLFARSRASSNRTGPVVGAVPERRALLYVCVAFLAWIHAAEGLFVLIAVATFDFPTAPANDRRTLAAVGAVFALALVPLFVTNLLVGGDIATPPRALSTGSVGVDVTSGSGGGAGDPTGGGTPDGSSGGGIIDGAVRALGNFVSDFLLETAVGSVVSSVLGIVVEGVASLFQVEDLYRTFVRSDARALWGGKARFRGVNLTVLESMPLLAAAAGAVAAVGRDVFAGSLDRGRDVTATDGLAGALCLVFVLVYASRLPLHAQINARYLLPVYPLGLYLVARSSVIRAVVSTSVRSLVWTYACGVLVGTQLLVVYVVGRGLAVAEAVQLHAVVGLVVAAALAVVLVGSAFDERVRAPAAVALGVAAAAGTAVLLLSGLHYFDFLGNYVLPVSGAVSDVLG